MEESTNNLKNPNKTWVIHKITQVGWAIPHKTKIQIKLTTINLTHYQAEVQEEREGENQNTANKDHKEEIKTFGAVLVLTYDKLDLKKSFDVSENI